MPPTTVTEDYSKLELGWADGLGMGYVGRAQLLQMNGILALCGAGTYVSASNRLQTRTVLKRAKMKMNGKVILRDLTYFAPVDSPDKVIGAQASCKSTGVAAPKGQAKFEMDYGVGAVRF